MFENHKLKSCFIEYLSNSTFKDSTYGEIFHGFRVKYPEYACDYSYQQAYRLVRCLVNYDLIIIDKAGHNYKYSSNYTIDDLNKCFIGNQVDDQLRNQICNEFTEVSMGIEKLRLELAHIEKYMKKYPNIRDKILEFKWLCCTKI